MTCRKTIAPGDEIDRRDAGRGPWVHRGCVGTVEVSPAGSAPDLPVLEAEKRPAAWKSARAAQMPRRVKAKAWAFPGNDKDMKET